MAKGKLPAMTLLPVVARELRVRARHGRTYLRRIAVGCVALFLAWYIFESELGSPTAGRGIFLALAWIGFFYALSAGPRLTADAISRERRENTLGLLFLTRLKGYDVALGKLVGSSAESVYALLAAAPVLGLSMLLGGVSLKQFLLASGSIGATLFFSLAAGLLASCFSTRSASAFLRTSLLVGAIVLGPYLLIVSSSTLRNSSAPAFWAMLPSPLTVHMMATSPTAFRGASLPPGAIWIALGAVTLEGAICLAGACAVLPRLWRESSRDSRRTRLDERIRGWILGGSEARRARRLALLDRNPFLWLRCRPCYPGLYPLLGIFGPIALFWIWGRYVEAEIVDLGVWTSMLLHILIKVVGAFLAVSGLAEQRRSGAFELLLCAPLKPGQMILGQWSAFLRRMGPALLITLLLADPLVWLIWTQDVGFYGSPASLALFHWTNLAFDAAAMPLMALWYGPLSASAAKAAGKLILRLMLLPWLAVMALGFAAGSAIQDETVGITILFTVKCGNALFWAAYAARRFRREIREAVATPLGETLQRRIFEFLGARRARL